MRWLILPLQAAALILLTYLYLYPGSQALFDQRTDTVMSDDSDPVTLTYAYNAVINVWKETPSRYFYGTVYTDKVDPERGAAYWMPWNERWIVLASSYFFPLEQLSTALVFVLLILDALCMYALCRYWKWNRSIASGLAIAWAFCAFTRARAKVHGGMTGTYHLPLIFLALSLIARGKGRRSLTAAMACLLLAATVAHYYLVTTLFLSPFFILFLILQPGFKAEWKRILIRLTLAALPAVLFLGFNFLKTIPSDVKMKPADSFPTSGETANGQTHPFLYFFAAHPLDYLGGDISLSAEPHDPSPLRQMVNEEILRSIALGGNPHERTNGIRWIILILGLAAVIFLAVGRFHDDTLTRNNIFFFTLFAAFTFWLSLAPDVPFAGWGPSGWLQSLIHQVRVPSRAGINVHFALLMVSGFLLASKIRWRKLLQYPGVFPLLVIAGYPPLVQNIPMAPIRPLYAELQPDKGPCGAGFYFPFVNFYDTNNLYYNLFQKMRRSECPILNNMSTLSRLRYMASHFPPDQNYLNRLPFEKESADLIEKLARCVPLTWIAFDPAVPADWREKTCARLGWHLYPDLTCIAPDKGAPLRKFPDECQ